MAFESLTDKLQNVFKKLRSKGRLTEEDVKLALKEVKMALLEADVNFKVVKQFTKSVQEQAIGQDVMSGLNPGQMVIKIVNDELVKLMGSETTDLPLRPGNEITVFMMAGLQGAGKTTTVAKLAGKLKSKGKKPLLVACDVYRPAAITQLQVNGEKQGVEVFSMGDKQKPVDIAKAAIEHAKANQQNVVLIDTAGRLHVDEDMMQELAPEIPIHVSTQANNINYRSAIKWYKMGATRVVLAREMSFKEIAEFQKKIPEDLELEAFIHGAMCISYSGRCLLSNYMTGRDSNMGACAHPCRWNYKLVEETRPGEYMDVFENERGTFIFNSKDLCTIRHIPELVQSGIASLKIEGRVKTSYYVATVVGAYRREIDRYCADPENYVFNEAEYEELCKVSHRPYTTGFYFGKPDENTQIYDNNTYVKEYTYLGYAEEVDENGFAHITQRNKFTVGETIEIMKPDGRNIEATVKAIYDEDGNSVESAPHPQQKLAVDLGVEIEKYDLLRRSEA